MEVRHPHTLEFVTKCPLQPKSYWRKGIEPALSSGCESGQVPCTNGELEKNTYHFRESNSDFSFRSQSRYWLSCPGFHSPLRREILKTIVWITSDGSWIIILYCSVLSSANSTPRHKDRLRGRGSQLSTRTCQVRRQVDLAAGLPKAITSQQARDRSACLIKILAAPVCHWLLLLSAVKSWQSHPRLLYKRTRIFPLLVRGLLHMNNHQYQDYALFTLRVPARNSTRFVKFFKKERLHSVRTFTLTLLDLYIHRGIILLFTLKSPKWSLPFTRPY